jgi:hypothetical protein
MKTAYRKKEDIKLVFSPESVLTRAVIIIFGEFLPHGKRKFEISHLVNSRKNTATFGKITKLWKPQNWKKKALNKGFGIALPVPSNSSFKSSIVRM